MSASAEEVHLSSCLNGWTGAELEFFAEEEMVAVKPNFSQDVIPLLGATDARTVGPFRPPLPAMVPLWMAVQLKKQRRGELVCPAWLTVQSLDAWLEEERTQDSFSTPPIVAYAEVARVLLHYARDDLGPDAPAIEERLGDIRDVRAAKIKKGLNLLNDDIGTYIKLGRMGSMEVNTIRSFAIGALSKFKRLHTVAEAGAASTGDSQLLSQQQQQQQQALPLPAPVEASSMRAGAQSMNMSMNAAQRNGLRNAVAAVTASQQHHTSDASSSSTPSQPGAPQQQGEEQARKLRRYGN